MTQSSASPADAWGTRRLAVWNDTSDTQPSVLLLRLRRLGVTLQPGVLLLRLRRLSVPLQPGVLLLCLPRLAVTLQPGVLLLRLPHLAVTLPGLHHHPEPISAA